MSLDGLMVWVDIETFGLDTGKPTIELGLAVTDTAGNVFNKFQQTLWSHQWSYYEGTCDQWVKDTHTKSGLFAECKRLGVTPTEVELMALEFLDDNAIREDKKNDNHLCGSSVHFDRKFLDTQFPNIAARFHYRMVDVSAIKLLYEDTQAYSEGIIPPNPRREHRVIPDLEDTIGEYRFYRDNFLRT